jgi:phosphoenolpyruvate carboxylase
MGQWIGGDRDGNPNVTAESLELALTRQADVALRHYLREVHYLGGELSLSANLVDITPEMQALADASPDHNVHRSDEPYRRALTGIYARLAATLRQLTGGEAARHAVAPRMPMHRPTVSGRSAGHRRLAVAPRRCPGAAAPAPADACGAGLRLPSGHGGPAPKLGQARGSGARAALGRQGRADYSLLEEDAKCALLVRLLEDARPCA